MKSHSVKVSVDQNCVRSMKVLVLLFLYSVTVSMAQDQWRIERSRHSNVRQAKSSYADGDLAKSDGLIKALLARLLQQVVHPSSPSASERKRALKSPSKGHKKSTGGGGRCEPTWGRWTDWSCCSTTCGKGRQIRWRHCLDNCDGVETEMEEKTCQLPACCSKLFGFISL